MPTTTKTLRLKFKSDEGKQFSLSLGNPGPQITAEGGKDITQAAVDVLIAEQIFSRTIAECLGADIVEKTTTAIL